MPELIIQHGAQRWVGALHGNVVIGRLSDHALVIGDPDVSRWHAQIVGSNDRYAIIDLQSRAGTRVNDRPVRRKTLLNDGDRIAIGPTVIEYRDGTDLPPDAAPMDLVAHGRLIEKSDQFLRMRCSCGKRITVVAPFSTTEATCSRCGQQVRIPDRVDDSAILACGICHGTMASAEPEVVCPGCGLIFHKDCWIENHGCSAYGCTQVNALSDSDAPMKEMPVFEDEAEHTGDRRGTVLVAGSVLLAVLSLLTFGVPAAGAGLATIWLMRRRPECRRDRRTLLAAGVCAVGIIAGVAMSWFWWFDQSLWPGRHS